ncbi:uncharacterized protein MAM_05495 [Metarhizium album ARSEF 1941]|uniref:Uncharacterized protein n=1 Tax=Metarhizium album (strain ARSEF 1941) TaxID=1081103 RepID=A0A0B2WST7_METAS|nr:uncharacterized protein MAM_05495 [Metarhizium album ARSEF 1941]KHN96552.1 hypothetical protein MAM_05495 [Metarhizium album ARSEF 1941]
MASANRRPLTYHVVPRFDIAADGGPLALGTVVSDLATLRPLNHGRHHVEVPDELLYAPVTQTNFKDTLAKVRELNVRAWAEALRLPYTASASIGLSKGVEDSVSCEAVVTTYFDPDLAGDYVKTCFAVRPIQDVLDAARGHKADFFIVTGLKVAKRLKFNDTSYQRRGVQGEVSGEDPQVSSARGGVECKISGEKKQRLAFEADDIVIGFRVHKYHCVRNRHTKDLSHRDEGLLTGDLQGDGGSGGRQGIDPVDELLIREDDEFGRQAGHDGDDEVWDCAAI